jgi:predicted ArsR family transcriptional regulator
VESFKKLEAIKFIERYEKINGRGRPQDKFKITKKGLEALCRRDNRFIFKYIRKFSNESTIVIVPSV